MSNNLLNLGGRKALPVESGEFLPTMQAPQKTWRYGFDASFASGVDPAFARVVSTGAGMAISQAAGSLVVTTGTTTYAETIIRSTTTWADWIKMRYSLTLSQRIANADFYLELVDVIGDGLAFTVNSAVSVTVTIPNNPFTAANVGQSMYLGAMTLAACPAGRFAIASISGNDVTFTVASWPASGTGTLSLFGWNYHHLLYTSTTATNVSYDAQRNGWASGETVATINTTASGHIGVLSIDGAKSTYLDQLSASSTTVELAQRASRVRNVPTNESMLYIQIRAVNGSVAPASTSTLTVGFVEVDNYVPAQMSLVNVEAQGSNIGLPVTISSTTTLTPGTAGANLGKAEDAAAGAGDTGVFILAVRRDAPTVSAGATGDYNEIAATSFGALTVANYEKQAKTFSASASLAAAAAATDIAILPGNASNTVYVTRVTISGIQTTGGLADVQLVKRSTANSGGTSAAMTAVPHDSTDAAAVSAPLSYTANPTPGTPVGSVRRGYLPIGAATAAVNPIVVFDFGDKGRPIVLRGVAQGLAVNLGGATLAGGTFDVNFEWFEI